MTIETDTAAPGRLESGLVALHSGSLDCLVAPACGGSIARLRLDRPGGPVDLLRPASPAALAGGSAPDMACFPLVPFSNRIAGGQFGFRGRTVRLPTDPGSPHTIHGHGWSAAWTVDEAGADFVRLGFRHEPDEWPWRYAASQTITVTPDGLTVALEVINLSDEPMPAGLGLHPYFPKPPGTVLAAGVEAVWENDATVLPLARRPVPPEWDFRHGTAMDGMVLDNGFTGWDGLARLSWPTLGLGLEVTAQGPFGHLIVYAPAGEDYLCVEPVSHMTDALNRPHVADAGVVTLAPGERLAGTVRLRVVEG